MEWRAWIWMPWNGYTMWWWWCSGRKMAEKCYIQYLLSSLHLMACTVGQSQTILCMANRYRRYSIPFRFEFSYSASCVGYWFFFLETILCGFLFRNVSHDSREPAHVCFRFVCHLFTFHLEWKKKHKPNLCNPTTCLGHGLIWIRKKSDMKNDQLIHGVFFVTMCSGLGVNVCVCVWERWNATISNFPLIGFCKCIYLVLHSDDLHITS